MIPELFSSFEVSSNAPLDRSFPWLMRFLLRVIFRLLLEETSPVAWLVIAELLFGSSAFEVMIRLFAVEIVPELIRS